MTKKDQQRIEKLEVDVLKLTKTIESTLVNQERFANALDNILNYMEEHKMTHEYRPNKLDS